MIVREKSPKFPKIKAFFGRFSVWAKAAFVLALAVLVAGLCTAGTARSTGGAFYATEERSVVFYLDYNEGATLGKIHVNVGSACVPAGESFTLTFRSALRSSTSSTSWSSSYGLGKVTLYNIYAPESGAAARTNHNWVTAVDRTGSSTSVSASRCLVQVSFSGDMLVNEIAFEDTAGERIPAYVTEREARAAFEAAGNSSAWSTNYRNYFAAQEKYGDVEKLVDGDLYNTGVTAYHDYTQEEMYTLAQIDGILLGGRVPEGTFVSDADHGPFAVLLPLLGVLVFGRSPFGLRFFSAFAAAGLVLLAYCFMKELLSRERGQRGKNEVFALIFAALTACGGLVLTVGRLGLSYPFLALFLLASFAFLYRFFAFGIDEARPVRSASNILVSGLAFALAVACDPKAVVAAAGLLALFVAGAVRHARGHAAKVRAARAALSEQNAREPSEAVIRANLDAFAAHEAEERADYVYRCKLIYLLFFVSFVVGTVLVYALAGLPQLPVYALRYDPSPAAGTVGALSLLWRSFTDAFTLGNVTAYSAANASTAFGWLVSLKGATLFYGASEPSYIALNAQGNIFMAFTALLSFVFLTAYAILYAATGGKKGAYATEHTALILRAWSVLLAGTVSALLPYAFLGGASAAMSLPFSVFYFAFIPLAFYTAYVHDGGAKKKLFGVPCLNAAGAVVCGLCALYLLSFLLTLPMTFGFPFPAAAAAACFGWTSILGNGFYR